MKIESLEIKGLYGFMDKNLIFDSQINLLVGINGCGKTSVLNIIDWLLRLSLPDLCVTEYKSLVMKFRGRDKKKYSISLTQTSQNITIDLYDYIEKIGYPTVNIHLHTPPSELTKNESIKEGDKAYYESLKPEKEEIDTWNMLVSLFRSPVVIGLSRELPNSAYNLEKSMRRKGLKISQNIDPLLAITEIANKEYSVYKSKMITLNNRLMSNIMLSSFDKVFQETELQEILKKPIPEEGKISELETKVINFLQDNFSNTENRISEIRKYFDKIKKTLSNIHRNDSPISYLMNLNQIDKIRSLIEDFEHFEQESERVYMPIGNYLNVLNSFLVDSSKKVYFKKDTGELKYSVLDRQGGSVDKNRDIRTLSSGEKQILLQFTYLNYCKQDMPIFLIDEPELSLHPRWIENYLPSVEKIMSEDIQIFIATHSPVIVASRKEKCIVLLSYNN